MSNFTMKETEEIIIQKVDNDLHIAAIFIVLCAGFLGVFAPSFLIKRKWLTLNDKKFILGKAFSGGIILGTGFIHMLPEAQNQLNESLPEFPFSGFFAGMAAIFSLIIEQIAFEQIKKIFIKSQPKTNGNSQIKMMKSGGNHEEGHAHGVANLYTDEELCKKVNSFTIAHVLEIGIAFHSIIIGIALSVETEAKNFHALLIAICFHQLFEGFALGASMQGARIVSLLHLGIMMSIFSLATPIGQAIGLGVLEMYDEESSTALQTQGIFDSFSGGILIYMALVDLIGEDFKKTYDGNLRYWMLFALIIGFGFMAIIAIWA